MHIRIARHPRQGTEDMHDSSPFLRGLPATVINVTPSTAPLGMNVGLVGVCWRSERGAETKRTQLSVGPVARALLATLTRADL